MAYTEQTTAFANKKHGQKEQFWLQKKWQKEAKRKKPDAGVEPATLRYRFSLDET
jgi:hypothetical protein